MTYLFGRKVTCLTGSKWQLHACNNVAHITRFQRYAQHWLYIISWWKMCKVITNSCQLIVVHWRQVTHVRLIKEPIIASMVVKRCEPRLVVFPQMTCGISAQLTESIHAQGHYSLPASSTVAACSANTRQTSGQIHRSIVGRFARYEHRGKRNQNIGCLAG